jgi:hypothetical protein
MKYNDETLSAWIDGELDEQQADEIATEARGDSALAARIAAMRAADRALHDALDGALGLVPSTLSTQLHGAARTNVIGFKPRRAAPTHREWTRIAAAGAIAFAVGGVVMNKVDGGQPLSIVTAADGGLQAGPALAVALARAHSGERSSADRSRVTILARFQAADSRYCREFHLDLGRNGADAVACHEASGWQIEGWSAAPRSVGGFQTAAGPSAMAATIDRLGTRAMLDRSGENKAIIAGWK